MTDPRMLLWLLLIGGQAGLAVTTFRWYQRRRGEMLRSAGPRRGLAFTLAVLATLPSVVGFSLLGLLTLGGGSPVAQMSLGRMDLWSMWFQAWPALMLANAASIVATVLSLAILWRPLSEPLLFWFRVVGLASATYALFVLAPLFPDA